MNIDIRYFNLDKFYYFDICCLNVSHISRKYDPDHPRLWKLLNIRLGDYKKILEQYNAKIIKELKFNIGGHYIVKNNLTVFYRLEDCENFIHDIIDPWVTSNRMLDLPNGSYSLYKFGI